MAAVGPVELFEVREVLNERLTLLSQDPPRYRYGRVWVAPIEAVRGMSFDVVLVPGLAERMFPRKIVEDPLLLDADRRKRRRDGSCLVTPPSISRRVAPRCLPSICWRC